MLHVFLLNKTQESVLPSLFYIHFVKIICFRRSKDKTRLAGKKEEARGKMPIKAKKRDKGDDRKK